MERLFILVFFSMSIFGFQACEKYEITYGTDFAADIQPIFVSTCSGCHTANLAPDFTEGNVYKSLTEHRGGTLLDMDTPENSYILKKATDGHGANISLKQKEAIIKWITEGASEN